MENLTTIALGNLAKLDHLIKKLQNDILSDDTEPKNLLKNCDNLKKIEKTLNESLENIIYHLYK